LDIDALRAFITVSNYQSFTQASAHLCLTQSAISKRIAQFENLLGVKLFDRIGHKTRLTEAGFLLLPRAKKIILDIEDCQRQLKNLSNEVSGTLKIGTSHHIGLHRLPKILKQFKSEYPKVELNILFQDSEEACRGVEHGELEMGIVTLPTQPPSSRKQPKNKQLVTQTIWIDKLIPVASHSHSLAKLKSVSLAELAAYDAILPSSGTFTRSLLEQALANIGVSLKSSMATNYLETIKMLVSVGMGWSILPMSMLDQEIKILPIKDFEIIRPLGIVTHPEHSLSNAARALIKTLRLVIDS